MPACHTVVPGLIRDDLDTRKTNDSPFSQLFTASTFLFMICNILIFLHFCYLSFIFDIYFDLIFSPLLTPAFGIRRIAWHETFPLWKAAGWIQVPARGMRRESQRLSATINPPPHDDDQRYKF